MKTTATLLFGAAIAIVAAGCGDSSAVSPARTGSADAANRAVASPAALSDPGSLTPSGANHDVLSVFSVEHQVDLATERDGVVVSIVRDQGSTVAKGDILGQL